MNEQHHEQNGSSGDSRDELFWTAAQYAAGDLPDAAVEEFEARLEADQAAREALAQAVALSQAVVQIESTPVVAAPIGSGQVVASRRERTFVWIAVAASLLLAVVAYRWQTSTNQKVDEIAAGPTKAQQQLALVWIEGQDADDNVWNESTATNDPMFDDELDDLPSLATDPSAPDWLLAAVADSAATGK